MTGSGLHRPSGAALALTLLASIACPATTFAQQTMGPADPNVAPPPGDPIGPPQLKGFDLQGTRVVPAQPQRTTPVVITPAPPPPVAPKAEEPAAPAPRQQAAPTPATPRATTPPPAIGVPPPAAEPVTTTAPEPPVMDTQPVVPTPQPSLEPLPAEQGFSFTWLYGLALALAAGMLGYLIWLKRRRRDHGLTYELAAPEAPLQRAEPEPEPADPDPPAYLVRKSETGNEPLVVAAPASDGLVGIQIRPWLQLEFTPERVTATEADTSVQFDLVIANTGNAPAMNVRIDARMFNAGPQLEREIEAYFAAPVAERGGNTTPMIQPRSAASMRSTVSMPKAQLREIEVNGRRLFIPTVAITVSYQWGTGKVGRTSMSFLVGREPEDPSSRMSPFRLDQGPRVYRQLGQRQGKPAVLV